MADFLAADFNYPDFDTGTQIISPTLVQQLLQGVDPVLVGGDQDITPILVQQLATGIDPVLTRAGAFVGWGIPI